jgi:hypothetical protein
VAGKEAAEKEAIEKETVEKEATEKGDNEEEEDQSCSHRKAAMTTALSALSDFQESSVGSTVPFALTICISTIIVYSSTSNT